MAVIPETQVLRMPFRKRKFVAVWLLFLASSAGGFGSTYTVEVVAAADPSVAEKVSYRIGAVNAEGLNKKLTAKIEQFVKRGLSMSGYHQASDLDTADIIVDIACGAEEPRLETVTYTEAVAIETLRDTGIFYDRETPNMSNEDPGDTFEAAPAVLDTLDYEERTTEIKFYEKYLRVSARVVKMEIGTENSDRAWTVIATTTDDSASIRRHLPILTAAFVRYVGEQTNAPLRISLESDDPIAASIKAKN